MISSFRSTQKGHYACVLSWDRSANGSALHWELPYLNVLKKKITHCLAEVKDTLASGLPFRFQYSKESAVSRQHQAAGGSIKR